MISEQSAMKCAELVQRESLRYPQVLQNSPTAVALITLWKLLVKGNEQLQAYKDLEQKILQHMPLGPAGAELQECIARVEARRLERMAMSSNLKQGVR